MTTEALAPASAAPAIATGGAGEIVLPQVIVDAGPSAVARFLEFFAGRIANARTRAAYGRAVGQFLGWCDGRGLGLRDVSPLHVAAYIRTHPGSVPTVKQHLAAIRMLGDWLVVNQVLPVNPAAAGRGPKPAHHRAAAALDAYVEATVPEEPKAALFQTMDPASRRPTGRALERRVVLAMVSGAPRPRGCRPRRAATRSGRRGSRRTCRTGGRSSTRSRSRGTRLRRRRSSTTGRRTR